MRGSRQWRRFKSNGTTTWQPLTEDRNQADCFQKVGKRLYYPQRRSSTQATKTISGYV